jgi:hypothetical protein
MLQEFLARMAASIKAATTPSNAAPGVELHRIRGFQVEVINERPDIKTDDAIRRLDAALALIDLHAPERLGWLGQDVARIWVRRFPCRAAFYPEPRACLVELTFLVNPRHTAAEVASSIVHEGVHARVAAGRGIPLRPASKAEEERLCRQAELEFGLSLGDEPGADVVVERARQSLILADQEVAPEIDWSLAAKRVEEADRDSRAG